MKTRTERYPVALAENRGNSDSAGAVIVAAGLRKDYGNVQALDEVSLEIHRKRVVGLVGPNGAGKTTLVGCLSGIVEPDAGRISIFGEPFHLEAVSLKCRIGVMPADLGLFEELRVREFLDFIGRVYRVDSQTAASRIQELCEALELADAEARMISELSSGMRQKLAFAAAVLHRPEVLILDEPFANVDPGATAMLKDWLRGFVTRDGTVLLTSHGLESLERLCDELIILHEGRIRWQGIPETTGRAWQVTFEGHSFARLEDLYMHLIGGKARQLTWL